VVTVGVLLLCCYRSWCGFYFVLLMLWSVGVCLCVRVGVVVVHLYLFVVVYYNFQDRVV
jgi:hypothetical protein